MHIKSIFLLLAIVFFTLSHADAQTDTLRDIEYTMPEKYEIGAIKVVGAKYADENALINISGLSVGKVIEIPGTAVGSAIKKLWDLRLFSDIKIVQSKTIGEITFLEIHVQEKPRYTRHSFTGVKKSRHEDLNEVVKRFLDKGAIITENVLNNIEHKIKDFYREKSYLDAEISFEQNTDPVIENAILLDITVDKGKRVKIAEINFTGNTEFKDWRLRWAMKETKRKFRSFKKSKFEQELYEEDKKLILAKYHSEGYKDVKIQSDTMYRNDKGHLVMELHIDEGKPYYVRNISWNGNNIYTDQTLSKLLGISKGSVYNTQLLEQRLTYSLDGRDVSSLYMDDGYLFFRIEPVEKAIVGDSVDLEMKIFEGPKATIDKVTISGNDRTNEHVIRRELRTKPGKKFSRSDIIRSQRQLTNLGYFDPQQLGINTPVNQQRYTVDIEYQLVEKSNDQLELSAGYGQVQKVIGTLGVVFNNFSLRNFFNSEAWQPLPTGDGQRLSIRAQTNGSYYQTYNASFTEPWLGGHKPTKLTVGGYYTRFSNSASYLTNTPATGYFANTKFYVGLGSRLKWPDDNFIVNAQLGLENIVVSNYPNIVRLESGRYLSDGKFNNFALELTLARTSINEQIYPTSGSTISVKGKFTLPYSLIKPKENYPDLTDQEKYRFLEYHKWRIDLDWYTTLIDKLVFRANAKIGLLGYYNQDVGLIPFERYEVGGAGLNNQQFGQIGKEIISTRGYETTDFAVNDGSGDVNAGTLGTVFDKFTLELRYPISLNPQASIYVLTFLQGSNAWYGLENFNPFDIKRSAGAGLRAYLPMFGLIGFDYGFGFDKPQLIQTDARWTDFATFNLVLGFEPD